VPGPANEFAHAVARRVASWADGHFNPVVFHSAYGFGKTHLLNAMAWEAMKAAPEKRVVYLTAERFLSTFVRAVMDRSTALFKEELRAADLLLIDGGGNDAADLVTAYLRAAAGDTAIYPALLLTVLSGDVVSSTLAMPNGAAQAGNLYMNKLADRFYNAIQTHALDKGAKRVAILNVPAVTNTPRFQLVLDSIAQANGGGTAGATARAQAKALFDSWVVSFNTQLGVRASGNSAVAIVDFYAAFNDQLANPAKYGLANTTTPVCPATGAGSDGLPNYNFQTCTAALLSSAPLIPAGATANWWQTYLFSDGFHPTPFGHQLLADAVATRLRQAGWL